MAFTDFKNTGQVLRHFNISAQKNNFIAFSTMQQTPVRLAEDINFVLEDCKKQLTLSQLTT